MSVIDEIGNLIPDVVIDNVTMEQNRVVIHMHIKEYVYPNGVGTWITREDFTSLMRIRVVKNEKSLSLVDPASPFDFTEELVGSLTADQHRLSQEYVTDKSRREKLQKVPYRMVLDNFNYDGTLDLSFTAYTEVSKQDLSDRINFAAVGFTGIRGRNSTVDVLSNGEANTRDVGYFLGESFYTGPRVQLENGRWVTGFTQNEDSEFLTVRNIPNIKVSDFRDIYTNLDNRVNLSPYLTDDSQATRNYFSDISSTRDIEGSLKFIYTFDYRSFYQDKALYGELFSTMPRTLQDRVLINSRISSMVLTRKRAGVEFEDASEDNIASSGEPSGDRFQDVTSDVGSLKEEELGFEKGFLFLRHFSGTDKDFKNINRGKYKYSVNITVNDGIYNFLTFQETDLKTSQQLLQEYRNEIDIQGNYDDQSDTYSEEFILKLKEKYEFQNLPYIRALVSLSENISFLTGRIQREELKKILNSIRFLISPRTGTKEGVDQSISLLAAVLAKIQSIKELVDRNIVYTSQALPRARFVYNIKEEFDEEFDASKTFKNGISFLSSDEIANTDDVTGLNSIEGLNFETRIEGEAVRFFGSKDAAFSISVDGNNIKSAAKGTSFTFLTPTAARIGDKVYVMHGNVGTSTLPDATIENLKSGETDGKYKTIMAGLTKPENPGVGIDTLAVSPLSELDFEVLQPLGVDNNSDSQSAAAITSFRDSIDTTTADYKNPFDTAKITGINTTPLPETVYVIALDGTNAVLSKSQFDQLPNHFKALYAFSASSIGEVYNDLIDAVDTGNKDMYDLLIGSLTKIMVLTGFEKNQQGKTIIKRPIFAPLTYELYRQYAGSNMLCRIDPYENSKISFNRSNDAAIYNKYFVLKSPILSRIFGEDQSNVLQSALNQAQNSDDLSEIEEAFGAPEGSLGGGDRDGDGDGTSVDPDACAVVADEKMLEQMLGGEQ